MLNSPVFGHCPPRLPGYGPGGAAQKAELTLAEMTAELERFLVDEYHNEPHTTTGFKPQERWTSGGFLPRMPESLEQLDLLLLTVPRQAADIAKEFYSAPQTVRQSR